jgi:hypothetical protein
MNQQDTQAGYIQEKDEDEEETKSRDQYLSKQSINSFNEKVGNNPFEAVESIFNEVPLININTQVINIKIPALTSDDLNNYRNYLTMRVEQNKKIIADRGEMLT